MTVLGDRTTLVDSNLAEFITGAVMMVVGTRDADLRPEIGRAVGARTMPGETGLEIIVSAWQYGPTLENIRLNGAVAVTFARPSDYVCYQVKGRGRVREADPAALMVAARYMAAMTEALSALGVPPEMSGAWLTTREAAVVEVIPEAVFLQTPGPGAGAVLKGAT